MEKKTDNTKIIVKEGYVPHELSPMDFYEREQKLGTGGREIPLADENDFGQMSANRKRSKKMSPTMRHILMLLLMLLTITTLALAVMVFVSRDLGEGSSVDKGLRFKDFLEENEVNSYALDDYDSGDTAVLIEHSNLEGTMSFLNLSSRRMYTLHVDGATKFYDKYGMVLSASQVSVGDVADITFLKGAKRLTSLQLSASAWKYEGVEKCEIDSEKNQISIGADMYKLTSDTLFFAEGNAIELMDLNPADVLSIQGINKQVLSVTVEKGHGYLRLKNAENFIGGWIEIGQSMICKITEDMLLAVPEGDFEVTISYRGGGGKKVATIYRDEETTLDIGDLEIPTPKSGQVLFSVNPVDAEIYIDGTRINTSGPVNLLYGLHQMIVRAEGYLSITQYIRVAQPTTGINVTLDLAGSDEGGGALIGAAETTTDYYKVYVDAPVDAEVYVDGNYIGIAPCSFRKKQGTYVIILRKSGCVTRSYTVNIDDSEKDLSYSFADLVENP